MKELNNNNKLTSKTTGYQAVNNESQVLTEAKNYFQDCALSITQGFQRSENENELPPAVQ